MSNIHSRVIRQDEIHFTSSWYKEITTNHTWNSHFNSHDVRIRFVLYAYFPNVMYSLMIEPVILAMAAIAHDCNKFRRSFSNYKIIHRELIKCVSTCKYTLFCSNADFFLWAMFNQFKTLRCFGRHSDCFGKPIKMSCFFLFLSRNEQSVMLINMIKSVAVFIWKLRFSRS